MKPVSKREARWKYWREENPHPKHRIDRFNQWAKKQMRRARRAFHKNETKQDL